MTFVTSILTLFVDLIRVVAECEEFLLLMCILVIVTIITSIFTYCYWGKY